MKFARKRTAFLGAMSVLVVLAIALLSRNGNGPDVVEPAPASLPSESTTTDAPAGGDTVEKTVAEPPPEVDRNTCLECHPDAEGQSGEFDGIPFSHQSHVGSRLPCTRCHSSFDAHGAITLASAEDCSSCHHAGAIECATCHGELEDSEILVLPAGDFSHPVHLESDLSCGTCHTRASPAGGELCGTCHDSHHRQDSKCERCHRESVQAAHVRGVHSTACTACHGEKLATVTAWTRSVCESCHGRREDHYTDEACATCHRVPPM